MDIQLIEVDPNTGVVTLKMSHKPVKGLTKLVQIVVLSLLNVPGKDFLDPDKGGGIPEMIGMNFNEDLSDILSEVTLKVGKTQSEIFKEQIGIELSPSEKLKEVKIVSVTPGATSDEVFVKLRIINELGQQSDIVM
jgi:hypothetical protein